MKPLKWLHYSKRELSQWDRTLNVNLEACAPEVRQPCSRITPFTPPLYVLGSTIYPWWRRIVHRLFHFRRGNVALKILMPNTLQNIKTQRCKKSAPKTTLLMRQLHLCLHKLCRPKRRIQKSSKVFAEVVSECCLTFISNNDTELLNRIDWNHAMLSLQLLSQPCIDKSILIGRAERDVGFKSNGGSRKYIFLPCWLKDYRASRKRWSLGQNKKETLHQCNEV